MERWQIKRSGQNVFSSRRSERSVNVITYNIILSILERMKEEVLRKIINFKLAERKQSRKCLTGNFLARRCSWEELPRGGFIREAAAH